MKALETSGERRRRTESSGHGLEEGLERVGQLGVEQNVESGSRLRGGRFAGEALKHGREDRADAVQRASAVGLHQRAVEALRDPLPGAREALWEDRLGLAPIRQITRAKASGTHNGEFRYMVPVRV